MTDQLASVRNENFVGGHLLAHTYTPTHLHTHTHLTLSLMPAVQHTSLTKAVGMTILYFRMRRRIVEVLFAS